MSTFLESMDKETKKKFVIGENDCPALESTSELLVDFFFQLVRGLDEQKITAYILKIKTEYEETKNVQLFIDLFILTFQTRDIRNGKGERDLFYIMFLALQEHFPVEILLLIPCISVYGSYLDFCKLMKLVNEKKQESISDKIKKSNYIAFERAIISYYSKQLQHDQCVLHTSIATKDSLPILSLAAKWAPRENKQYKEFAHQLAQRLYPSQKNKHILYRKLIVNLSKQLDVTEIKMCANLYHEIDFSKVPSKCLNKNRKAFLNECLNSSNLRHSERESRNNCRLHLLSALATGKVNGKDMMPHELVHQLYNSSQISEEEVQIYDSQWQKIRENVLTSMLSSSSCSENSISLGKLVPMVDVSGSMSGTPMMVSIALGILVSELSHDHFRNRFLTFETNPSWVILKEDSNLKQKVEKTKDASWGGSTNFQKAFQLILKVATENKLSQEEIPDLIVFSDMQFNNSDQSGYTMFETMKREFSQHGYHCPKIIFWNLAADTTGFPVSNNENNVQLLSGFSPNLLKMILSGQSLVKQEKNEDGETVQKTITPAETLRKVLDDKNYDSIRTLLSLLVNKKNE
jgi:hypothetical protein